MEHLRLRLFLIFGFIISLLAKLLYNTDWSLTILGVSSELILVYLIIDRLLLEEERKKWKSIADKVKGLISVELYGVFIDFSNLVRSTHAIALMIDPEWSEEETRRKFGEEKLSRVRSFLEISNNQELRDSIEPGLLRGNCGKLFSDRVTNLNELESKYSKYLSPQELGALIDLQKHLKRLDLHIKIIERFSHENVADQSELVRAFAQLERASLENEAPKTVQQIFKVLLEAYDLGMFKIE